VCADGSGNDCYDETAFGRTTPAWVLCDFNHCNNGGTCVVIDGAEKCRCTSGYSGDTCDIVSAHLGSGSSANVGLIAGLSVLGAVLLIVAAALIFYFFVYPRIRGPKRYEAAPSDIASSEHGLTKFDQTSTRINKFWPRNAQRYAPETYTAQEGKDF